MQEIPAALIEVLTVGVPVWSPDCPSPVTSGFAACPADCIDSVAVAAADWSTSGNLEYLVFSVTREIRRLLDLPFVRASVMVLQAATACEGRGSTGVVFSGDL